MRPFAYERATDAARRGRRRRPAGDDVPRRRHQPRRPDEARRRDARARSSTSRGCRSTAIEERPDGGLRIGAAVRNSDLAAHRAVRERYPLLAQALLAGASGQLRNIATTGGNLLQRTRCAYFQDVSKPCNKREPGIGLPGARGRPPQPRDPRALRARASRRTRPTWPSRWPRSTRRSTSTGWEGERTIPIPGLHRLPGDEPQRDTVLEPGELITAVELPPLPARRAARRYRKVRDRASYAFAVVSVAAALDVDGRRGPRRAGSRSAASRTGRGARGARRRRCAAGRRRAERFAAAAEAELAQAQPLRDNAFKVPLARNLITSTLASLAGELA